MGSIFSLEGRSVGVLQGLLKAARKVVSTTPFSRVAYMRQSAAHLGRFDIFGSDLVSTLEGSFSILAIRWLGVVL
jgi:hypothetical protein